MSGQYNLAGKPTRWTEWSECKGNCSISRNLGFKERSRKIIIGKEVIVDHQRVDCQYSCPIGEGIQIRCQLSITFISDCSKISVRMTQTSQAARWKLETSLKKPLEDDIESLALVRQN